MFDHACVEVVGGCLVLCVFVLLCVVEMKMLLYVVEMKVRHTPYCVVVEQMRLGCKLEGTLLFCYL